ncbi:hypothetical protein D9M68_667770 [compost metagenome]
MNQQRQQGDDDHFGVAVSPASTTHRAQCLKGHQGDHRLGRAVHVDTRRGVVRDVGEAGQQGHFHRQYPRHPGQPRAAPVEEQADAHVEQDRTQCREEIPEEDGKEVGDPVPQDEQQGADAEHKEADAPDQQIARASLRPQRQHAGGKDEFRQRREERSSSQIQVHLDFDRRLAMRVAPRGVRFCGGSRQPPLPGGAPVLIGRPVRSLTGSRLPRLREFKRSATPAAGPACRRKPPSRPARPHRSRCGCPCARPGPGGAGGPR